MISLEFDKLILQLLPIIKRKPKRFAWLKALIYPLKSFYADFLIFYALMETKAIENSQTMILRKILNDDYDAELRRIVIQNKTNNKFFDYIYKRTETAPIKKYLYKRTETIDYFKKIFLSKRTESAETANSFNVLVPMDVFADDVKMKLILSRVNALKMATTTFSILKIT